MLYEAKDTIMPAPEPLISEKELEEIFQLVQNKLRFIAGCQVINLDSKKFMGHFREIEIESFFISLDNLDDLLVRLIEKRKPNVVYFYGVEPVLSPDDYTEIWFNIMLGTEQFVIEVDVNE